MSTSPPGVNEETWRRYLAGTRAFDDLHASGARCPGNPQGVRCTCGSPTPKERICRYWNGIEELVRQIGGATKEAFLKMK